MAKAKLKIKNLGVFLLMALSSCAYLREHPDDLKLLEQSTEAQIDVGIRASEPTLKEYQDSFKKK